MFTQTLLAAFVLGILIIIGKALRNSYYGKLWEFSFLTLLSYFLISISSFAFVLVNGVNFIEDSEVHTCVAVISLFSPVVIDFVFTRLAEKVLSSNRSGAIVV